MTAEALTKATRAYIDVHGCYDIIALAKAIKAASVFLTGRYYKADDHREAIKMQAAVLVALAKEFATNV